MCDLPIMFKKLENLPLNAIKKLIEEAKNLGFKDLVLTGGEPLLRNNIFKIIDYSISLGLRTEIVTNGTLIDEKVAERIINSGLNMIAVSLDSTKPKIHDEIRGVKNLIKLDRWLLFVYVLSTQTMGSRN